MENFDEVNAFFNRRTDKTIISKRFYGSFDINKERPIRIMSKIMELKGGLSQIKIGNEIHLRENPSGRMEIKVTAYENERGITGLTLQRFNRQNPNEKFHFSLRPAEITELLQFIAGVRTVHLPDDNRRHVTDHELKEIVLNRSQLVKKIGETPEALIEALENESITEDLVSVGYRRKQLTRFKNLLFETEQFELEQKSENKTPEGLWQAFFEQNKWIFGYGLTYQFLSSLDDRKLEQIVAGTSIGTIGKRSDGLLKTLGAVNSLCFVEIKTHKTNLLESSQYRKGVWSPSKELVGGVAQLQTTVQESISQLGAKLFPETPDGDPTGEILFNYKPKSFLVIGSLSQFKSENGINQRKLQSFELYRRNINQPEILTFDELYERAKFIVEHSV